jgi:fatty acid desaturase
MSRGGVFFLSRANICVVCLLAVGSLFLPVNNNLHLVLDILVRTYLIFLATVKAHESVHGNLGRTRRANFWWGRIALLPSMVPFTNFRRTHQLHHA